MIGSKKYLGLVQYGGGMYLIASTDIFFSVSRGFEAAHRQSLDNHCVKIV